MPVSDEAGEPLPPLPPPPPPPNPAISPASLIFSGITLLSTQLKQNAICCASSTAANHIPYPSPSLFRDSFSVISKSSLYHPHSAPLFHLFHLGLSACSSVACFSSALSPSCCSACTLLPFAPILLHHYQSAASSSRVPRSRSAL